MTKACFGTNAAAAHGRPIEPPKAPRVRTVPLLSSRRMYVAFESSAPKIEQTFFMWTTLVRLGDRQWRAESRGFTWAARIL